MKENDPIYPTILPVPEADRKLKGKEKVRSLKLHAETALMASARMSGVFLKTLEKSGSGAPLPSGGIYWSLSHKNKYVCAVVSNDRIGIDLEEIRPLKEALFHRIADGIEWGLDTGDRLMTFFRYWTSKEAVLKAEGVGLVGLSRCRIDRIIDKRHLEVIYMGNRWGIEHYDFDGHIASVVQNLSPVKWMIQKKPLSDESRD